MTREELNDLHERIATRLCEKQFAAYSEACNEDEKLFKRSVSLVNAWAMVVGAFAEAREIVREEIERK